MSYNSSSYHASDTFTTAPCRFGCSCFFVLKLLTAPANVLSSLVVEGYKKMMLVSLIICGNVPALPKYASNAVTRHLKIHTSGYEALGSCCQVCVPARRFWPTIGMLMLIAMFTEN